MSMEELRRLKVVEAVIETELKQNQAARVLGLSPRQIRRIAARVRSEGARGLIHRLRGQESNHKHAQSLKERVLKLCAKKYSGFGPTLAQEKLGELENLNVNRESLRQWMMAEGLWKQSRKGRKHRQWRERKECFGEMVQGDGSHHDWLEGRGPWLVLMGYIDDATGETFGRFYDYEGTLPVMESFYGYVKQYGLPVALYMDKHSTYQSPKGPTVEEQLKGREKTLTQFGRALEELGVELIPAHSPQAKGRIERLFRTLQDRLVKEMRLAGIKTKEAANLFLEKYLLRHNKRFAVRARKETNLHRPAVKDRELVRILSIQEKRVVRNDGTIRYGGKLYQILEAEKSLKAVTLQERMDGKMYVTYAGTDLIYHELQEAPRRFMPQKPKGIRSKPWIPPAQHPWKGASFREMTARQALVAA